MSSFQTKNSMKIVLVLMFDSVYVISLNIHIEINRSIRLFIIIITVEVCVLYERVNTSAFLLSLRSFARLTLFCTL